MTGGVKYQHLDTADSAPPPAAAPAPLQPAPSTESQNGGDELHKERQWASAGESLAVANKAQKELEAKERRLVESIQVNYSRIKEVERELSALQLQLRVNVGPKKQALEMLRRKIEAQNERVKGAAARRDVAKKAYDEAAEALAAEERTKEQLCAELNMLVQQSAHAQLDKLDQLTRRLELLNSGITLAEEARTAAGSLGEPRTASGEAAHLAAAVQHDADALRSKILAAANGAVAPLHHHHQQQQQGVVDLAYDSSNPFVGPPAGEAAATPSSATQHQQAVHDQERLRREAALEQQRAAEAERQRREAEAARSRHITIGRGRGGRPATQQPQAAGRGPAAAPLELVGGGSPAGRPRAVTDQGGEFRGFA